MTSALSLQSRDFARDLYGLLKAIDSARWREARVAELHAMFQDAAARARQILNEAGPTPSERVRARMAELSAAMEALPSIDTHAAREAWASFRGAMVPAYEALALALKEERLPVPSLRPTNYTRSLFHASSGLVAIMMVEAVLEPVGQTLIMLALTLASWGLELARHLRPDINDFLLRHLRAIAHPHERHVINSSTWMVTALLILSPLGSDIVAAGALAVLSFADPAAGLIGRRWGRTTLRPGKSLEGTLAFFAVAVLAPLAVMLVAHPMLRPATAIVLALAAAVPGTLAELFLPRPDDNFSIPLASAVGLWLATALLGVSG